MQDVPESHPTVPQTRRERRRAYLKEISGIVVGVVIALMLGAVATWVGWMIDAADAKRALALELGEILGQAEERVIARDCIERRLDGLGAVLATAAATGQLPPLGPFGDPPFRTWSTGVWDSTISADIASHMDRELLDNLSGAYEFVRIMSRETQAENDAWAALYAMVGPGRPVAPDEVNAMRTSLAQARMAHRMLLISSVRIRQIADAYGLPYDRGTVDEYAQTVLRDRYCTPLPPSDGKPYGQAPFSNTYQRMLDNPITRESESGFRNARPASASSAAADAAKR
jgi:hypothetical protein